MPGFIAEKCWFSTYLITFLTFLLSFEVMVVRMSKKDQIVIFNIENPPKLRTIKLFVWI